MAVVLAACTTTMAQTVVKNVKLVSAPPRIMAEELTSPLMLKQGNGFVSHLPEFSTDAVTSQKIGSSANYFGYANNGQKQSYLINDLDAVEFVFRNNPAVTGGGNTGHVRYNISSDRGVNWAVPTTGAGIGNINPTQTLQLRYPNSFLFTNPAIGGTAADVRLGVSGAALDVTTGTWKGYAQVVVGPNVFTNILTPVVEQEDYVLLQGPVVVQHVTERVLGEFWATAACIGTPNDTIYVLRGSYNAALPGVVWAIHDRLFPNWNVVVDSAAHWTMPKIEFSPNGLEGYVAVLGDLVGGQDSAYVPILWNYNNSTTHFGAGYEVNINQFPQLNAYISSFTDTLGVPFSNGTPTCAFNFDLSVDYEGDAHILCIVAPASSGMASLQTAYSLSSGFAMQVMDITKDFTGSWNMIHIWDQVTFREDLVSASPVSLDPPMHLARTQDGKFIFYSWSDTDTTGNPANHANDAPNLKGRFYDVQDDSISAVTDWTYNDAVWVANAQGVKTAGRVFESGSGCPGRTFNVPTTVCEIPGSDPATITDFYYFSDINYSCEDANLATRYFHSQVGIEQHLNVQAFKAYPNPATHTLTVEIALTKADDIEIALVNLAGQTLMRKNLSNVVKVNESFKVNTLSKGIYLLTVSTSQGTAADKIVIE